MEPRPRRSARYKQRPGVIRRVEPSTTTAETRGQAVRRKRESDRMVDPRIRRMRRRRRLVVSVLVLVLIVVAGVASVTRLIFFSKPAM
jgi:hypothetical protein